MKSLKRVTGVTLALLFSCTAFVGCGRDKKEEIPSMVLEPEKWEIEVRPGYFGNYKVGSDGLVILPDDPIADRYIPDEEIDYVRNPISYANREAFDQVLITYPYCERAYEYEWQYWPEYKCFYYNSKGERIESEYYASCFHSDLYIGDETEFEKIKNDTDRNSWTSNYFIHFFPNKKDCLYRIYVEIYDSIDSYKRNYDIHFDLSAHRKGWFYTYVILEGTEGEEK